MSIKFRTFDEAAEYVAKDFISTMQDEGFETFQEMAKCYMWETDDIKSEVYYILQDTNCEMWDDGSELEIGQNSIEWRKFSKLFRDKIRELVTR